MDPNAAMEEFERRAQAGALSNQGMAAWNELKARKGFKPPETQIATEQQEMRPGLRQVGLGATGFNKGLAVAVDLVNDGLKALGLPMSDEPFMGSAFVDKYLGGNEFRPANMFESVIHRAGLELGANVLPLAGAVYVKGATAGKEIVKAGQEAAGMADKAGAFMGQEAGLLEKQYRALKGIPAAMVEQLQQMPINKLLALETSLAAGAGAGAAVVHEVFPEGGAMAEFAGELLGSFSPTVVLGMVGKARQMAHTAARSLMAAETEGETKRRLGSTLESAATAEQRQTASAKADELGEKIPGLRLTAGEAHKGGPVTETQRAFESSPGGMTRSTKEGSPHQGMTLGEQREANKAAVKAYFDQTAPDGNTTNLVDRLTTERQALYATGETDVMRTQAHLEGIRGDIDKRKANLLNSMEARMQAADERIGQRLQAISPQLGKKQRGDLIRKEYQDEVTKFREQSRSDYHELDMLGHAELPTTGTISKLADIEAQFPEQLQAIRKINPRVANAIDHLGRDYELTQRAEKASADLGIRDASGPGFLTTDDLGRPTGGQSRGTPQWYKDLTIGEGKMDRETVENALQALKEGKRPGETGALRTVADAIRRDPEFRRSPYHEPVMDELNGSPSASLRDLRQVRSDLMALSRQARASDNRVQNYVLHELIGAVDADIDNLVPGSSAYANLYPEHGAMYRDISANYRQGVQTLYKGTANKLRRVNRYGDYTEYDESIPGLFWKNESTMQDFEKAFENRDMARIALRDYALENFQEKALKRMPDGRLALDQSAANEWIRQNEAKLKSFPELVPMFKDALQMQDKADDLRVQVTAYQQGKRGDELLRKRVEGERRPGEFSQFDVDQAEAAAKHASDIASRSKHDWEASKANLFLQRRASDVGYEIATSKDAVAEYDKARALVKNDPDAVAGLNKAIWEGLTEKLAPKLVGTTGGLNMGVLHKELQNWIEGHGGLMQKVLGPEGFERIKTANEAFEHIAAAGVKGSDTAIKLQVQQALVSTWLSRGFAIASGRVGRTFGMTERVANHLSKTFERMTQKQQDAILLESFFEPKVFQSLVNAATYGPDNQMVKHQLRTHLYNMSEQGEDQ